MPFLTDLLQDDTAIYFRPVRPFESPMLHGSPEVLKNKTSGFFLFLKVTRRIRGKIRGNVYRMSTEEKNVYQTALIIVRLNGVASDFYLPCLEVYGDYHDP